MMARLRLTTKQVNGGYYKGNRTGSMGYFDHKGNYVIDWKKVRTYVVPEGLDTFKVGSSTFSICANDPRVLANPLIAHSFRLQTRGLDALRIQEADRTQRTDLYCD
jgi:hypothetical protein